MVPALASRDSQLALSVAVHDSDRRPEFVNVTDAVVPLLPKSTESGDTWSLEDLPASSA